ncbi:hypothetical protein ABBQ32_005336 [Trebouxia sp. C0010 RCD-2024]
MLQSVFADMCNSGSSVAGMCVTENVTGGNAPFCTAMATGLACTTTDVCVRGAQCVGAQDDGTTGICQPNSKAQTPSTSPASNPVANPTPTSTATSSLTPAVGKGIPAVFSNASRVPTVDAVARLGDYATTDLFNATEKARVTYH